MPLFDVEIKVSKSILIPVYAKTLEEARRYMENEDDWRQDGSLNYEFGDLSVGKIEAVSDPSKCEWDERVNCWNPYCEDISAAEAFFDVELNLTEDDEIDSRLVMDWREAKAKAIEDYARQHRGIE
jgi:hypothetical protein